MLPVDSSVVPGLLVLNHNSADRGPVPVKYPLGTLTCEPLPLKLAAVPSGKPVGPATAWLGAVKLPLPVATFTPSRYRAWPGISTAWCQAPLLTAPGDDIAAAMEDPP